MRLGARILKTGIAVVLSYYICAWLELEPPLIAVIAAVLTTQPSIYQSLKYFIDQVQANSIGAVTAVLAVAAIGNQPIVIGLVVVIVIVINLFLKLESSITLSILTVIAVMGEPDGALNRFILVMLGVVLGILINVIFLPPNHERQLLEKLRSLHERILLVLRNITEGTFTEAALRKEREEIDEELKKTEELFQIYKKERILLKKYRMRKGYKLVIYRQMLDTLQQELRLLRSLRKRLDEKWLELVRHSVHELAQYHEMIFMKHEGRVKPKADQDKIHSVSSENEAIIARMCSMTEQQPPRLVPIAVAAQLLELEEDLDHLNKLVTSYSLHHKP